MRGWTVRNWHWSDATFTITFATFVATVLLAGVLVVVLWLVGRRDSKHLGNMQAAQAESIEAHWNIARRERRDVLLDRLSAVRDEAHAELLWAEVLEHEEPDRALLKRAFRANPLVRLPGSRLAGFAVQDDLDGAAVSDYVNGMRLRYNSTKHMRSFAGLVDFITYAKHRNHPLSRDDLSVVADVVTGDAATAQKPSHSFYRDLVKAAPASAGMLLNRIEDIRVDDSWLRLNLLTGVLLAADDAAHHNDGAADTLRSAISTPLAELLSRHVLRSLRQWNLEGTTEPVTATVAWLVRTTGWLADTNDHLAMRMIESLPDVIAAIPEEDRRHGWGVDSRSLAQGLAEIAIKQPELWRLHGAAMESAASQVGEWSDGFGRL